MAFKPGTKPSAVFLDKAREAETEALKAAAAGDIVGVVISQETAAQMRKAGENFQAQGR